MNERYTTPTLPSRKYIELIGTAICVFNSNNSFVIENILRMDKTKEDSWHSLLDKVSGKLIADIQKTITAHSNDTIANLFSEIVEIRNRIVHSFQITESSVAIDDPDHQMLATKHLKSGKQELITEEYLMSFIKKNEELSTKLHQFRGH